MSGNASERVAVVTASGRSLPALMSSIDPGHHFEQLARDMDRRAVAARSVADPARIRLRIADELGNSPRRKRWIYLHDKRIAHDARDRRDVANEVEAELVVERGVDRIRSRDHEQGMAVRGRSHDGLDRKS